MGMLRLNELAMLYINLDIACNVNAFVDEFARMNPQWLQLCNPVHTDKDN